MTTTEVDKRFTVVRADVDDYDFPWGDPTFVATSIEAAFVRSRTTAGVRHAVHVLVHGSAQNPKFANIPDRGSATIQFGQHDKWPFDVELRAITPDWFDADPIAVIRSGR